MRFNGEVITSRNNPLVKWASSLTEKKYRDSEKSFIIEGEKLAFEALAAGLPVMAGVGTNSLEHTIENIKLLEPHGVDAFLVVVPYYNKPSQQGLIEHFGAIAKSVDNKIIDFVMNFLNNK